MPEPMSEPAVTAPLTDAFERRRAAWRRSSGNPCASDATFEAALLLSNNKRCWDLIERQGLRNGAGRVDGAALERLFAPMLERLGDRLATPPSERAQIDWQQIAESFAVEPDRPAQALASAPVATAIAAPRPASIPAAGDEAGVACEAAPGSRAIEPAVLEVLARCRADAEAVFLPGEKLDRKLYEKVDAVLRALGGKWDRRLGGHRFEGDAAAALDVAVATGAYVSPQDFGFFPTPEALARELIEAADLRPGMTVLEPSAGRGALAALAAEIVGRENVHTVELLPGNRRVLEAMGFAVQGSDFLSMPPQPVYDRVIMNPPFENLADTEHVRHAARFLRPDGKLVSIASPSFLIRQSSKKAEAFRDLLDQAGEIVRKVPEGAFKESGTNVATVILSLDAARLPDEFRDDGQVEDQVEDQADAPRPRPRASA